MKQKILFLLYLLAVLGLFLYSFTEIDLSLTFSRITFLRNLVKSFQYIGYFQRPLSTYLYASILLIFHAFYITFLVLTKKRKLDKAKIWKLIIVTTIVFAFAYNAFSYDIFNYIFDAKIITHYHQNPYIHKALDYPGDPMLSFMRWTHRVYPYGPIWLVLTVPLSFIGHNFFIPTFLLFKFLMAGSFLGSLYFIAKILRKLSPEKELWGIVFFGLNPLVLIESLVSGHMDIVMIFFALWSFYLLIEKRNMYSFLILLISIGIKFATGFLFPVYLFIWFLQWRKKKIPWTIVFYTATILMISTVAVASNRTTFQPWYLLEPLAFAALLPANFITYFPTFIISLFALFTYIPYLFTGNWDPPIPQILAKIYISSYVISGVGIVAALFMSLLKRKTVGKKKNR
jgi:hypothetical protein